MVALATMYLHGCHGYQVFLWLPHSYLVSPWFPWEPDMGMSYGWVSSCSSVILHMLCDITPLPWHFWRFIIAMVTMEISSCRGNSGNSGQVLVAHIACIFTLTITSPKTYPCSQSERFRGIWFKFPCTTIVSSKPKFDSQSDWNFRQKNLKR